MEALSSRRVAVKFAAGFDAAGGSDHRSSPIRILQIGKILPVERKTLGEEAAEFVVAAQDASGAGEGKAVHD